MIKTKPSRVLHIVSATQRGGAETLVMDVYRNIDRTKVQFDFISHSSKKCDYDDEIKSLGGNVFRVNSIGQKGVFKYLSSLISIMNRYPYAAVHSHTDYQGGFGTLAGKITGIKKRIIHSHSNNWDHPNGVKSNLTLSVLKQIIKFSSTDYCACSKDAARFLFNKGLISKVKTLKNGIEVSKYLNISKDNRTNLLSEFKIPSDSIIIGHVGRFSSSKNHIFLLNIIKNLLNESNKYYGVFVGDGALKSEIEQTAKKLGIINNIRFTGVRSDIPQLMNAFDVFVFPSFYEGFGIVTLEAQCSGIPCVVSNSIPKTTDMGLGLISYVSLNESIESWSNEIKNFKQKNKPDNELIEKKITELGFNIIYNINDWLDLYDINN